MGTWIESSRGRRTGRVALALAACIGAGRFSAAAEPSAPAESPEPFPRVEAVPLPNDQASLQIDGVERLRLHYAARHDRPFWYPLIGPAGRPVTRMTHPHDPHGHRHHQSIWIAHHDVNGMTFWSGQTGTRILCERVEAFDDGPDAAAVTIRNRWLDPDKRTVLTETRTTRLRPLPDRESLIEITLVFTASHGPVTFGKTPFGFLGVRVAKRMGVHDGGGTIRNDQGGVNEKGVFWKPARWVDYSGRVAAKTVNGITLMDHPANPRHPTYFHVRDDGWMGTSFCLYEPYTLEKGRTLRLRYALYVHGEPSVGKIERQWARWVK